LNYKLLNISVVCVPQDKSEFLNSFVKYCPGGKNISGNICRLLGDKIIRSKFCHRKACFRTFNPSFSWWSERFL